mmetsp:Transcript_8801/g.11834  ORF Transcript_8801/g.11834 Transcript_8801/m.11834 type:complete len:333 (+) Transcript_8801:91-1089(+)|eukprot:CAMPEP_0201480428 /NCGR_PEP_ID=MMETSP0151_2-20130828/4909_1 /ASSEMBLY_ACC=CAM_ASM_000257 /TAXON_ID=200890 /ORGANISM="Paramoeba atlantica, Strain 621/1 / CCAP 1560/9" /LENGTH=332 /DNA_ID=CAMNT_0047862271 /DNA_START=91 /DNA_END=1089 /DNA_ORIENTATION=+
MSCIRRTVCQNKKVAVGVTVGALYLGYSALGKYTDETPTQGSSVKLPADPGENLLENSQGLFLYTKSWVTSPPADVRGIVFFIHGMNEHCNRYSHVAEALNGCGFAVHSMDHQGFGRSQGIRAYVKSFEDFVEDYLNYINLTRQKYPDGTPFYLICHSMGGLIGYLLAPRVPVSGVIYTGICYELPPHVAPPHLKALAGVMSNWFPKGSLPVSTLNINEICRDPVVVQEALDDPLYVKEPVSFRLAYQLFTAIDTAQKLISHADYPVMFLHGREDKICLCGGSTTLFEAHQNEDKTIKIYDGMFHEVLHDNDKEMVIEDIKQWLLDHSTFQV